MAHDIKIITGPDSKKVSKRDAEKQLRSHPAFPKRASVQIEDVEGRWVAAIVKNAEFPPSDDSDTPDTPAPDDPSDEPDAPSDDSDSPFPDKDEDKSEKSNDKGSEKSEIAHLTKLVTTLLTALGINPEGGEDDSPVPGLDAPGDGPPPHEESADGPDLQPDGKSHTVHERALKPGETPPGTTPVGAPAFASTKVADNHPWKEVLGETHSFPVEEVISDEEKLADVKRELDSLADGTGYHVHQLTEARSADGQRVAKALISR